MRLAAVANSGGFVVQYAYDIMNRVTNISWRTTHDAAGNVTRIERDGGQTLDLTWNSQHQLVSVSTNGVFAERYTYDALSRRVSTTTLEGTTRHVYDNNWQVIADIDDGDGRLTLLAVFW